MARIKMHPDTFYAANTMRYIVAFIAVLSGIAGAALEFHLAKPALPQPKSLDESAFIMGLCVTFYGLTYAMGRLVYAVLGRTQEQAGLLQTARWHLLILHVLALGIVVAAGFATDWRLPLLRPAVVVPVLLVAWSIWDCSRAWRRGAAEDDSAETDDFTASD